MLEKKPKHIISELKSQQIFVNYKCNNLRTHYLKNKLGAGVSYFKFQIDWRDSTGFKEYTFHRVQLSSICSTIWSSSKTRFSPGGPRAPLGMAFRPWSLMGSLDNVPLSPHIELSSLPPNFLLV